MPFRLHSHFLDIVDCERARWLADGLPGWRAYFLCRLLFNGRGCSIEGSFVRSANLHLQFLAVRAPSSYTLTMQGAANNRLLDQTSQRE